ncbi:MAG: preprotein translocase subunit YajC [Clostridium sp.]
MEMIMGLLPIAGMFAVMYFAFIRPEKKRSTQYNEMLSQLTKGEEILTRGGIVGKIISIDDEYLVITTGPDKIKLKIAKTGIAMKINTQE